MPEIINIARLQQSKNPDVFENCLSIDHDTSVTFTYPNPLRPATLHSSATHHHGKQQRDKYDFHRAYDSDASDAEIYQACVEDLLNSSAATVTILMFGFVDESVSHTHFPAYVTPSIIRQIFEMSDSSHPVDGQMSYFQIRHNCWIDLLDKPGSFVAKEMLFEENGVDVCDIPSMPFTDANMGLDLFRRGQTATKELEFEVRHDVIVIKLKMGEREKTINIVSLGRPNEENYVYPYLDSVLNSDTNKQNLRLPILKLVKGYYEHSDKILNVGLLHRETVFQEDSLHTLLTMTKIASCGKLQNDQGTDSESSDSSSNSTSEQVPRSDRLCEPGQTAEPGQAAEPGQVTEPGQVAEPGRDPRLLTADEERKRQITSLEYQVQTYKLLLGLQTVFNEKKRQSILVTRKADDDMKTMDERLLEAKIRVTQVEKSHVREVAGWRSNLDAAQKLTEQRSESLDEARNDLKRLTKASKKLKSQNSDLNELLQQQETKSVQNQKLLEETKETLASAEKEISDLRHETDEKLKDLENECEKRDVELEKTHSYEQKWQDKAGRLEEKCGEFRVEIEDQMGRCKELTQINENLKRDFEATALRLQKEKTDALALTDHIQVTSDERDNLKGQLESARDDLKGLQSHQAIFKRSLESDSSIQRLLKDQIQTLKKDKQKLEDKMELCGDRENDAMNESMKRTDELRNLKLEFEQRNFELERKVNLSKTENEKSMKLLQNSNAARDSLQKRADRLTLLSREAKSNQVDLKSDVAGLESELKEKERDLSALCDDLAAQKQLVEASEENELRLRDEMRKERRSAKSVEIKLQKTERALKLSKQQEESSRSKLSDCTKKLREVRMELENAKSEVESSTILKQDLEAEITALQANNKLKETELHKFEDLLDSNSKQSEGHELSEQELQKKLRKAQRRLDASQKQEAQIAKNLKKATQTSEKLRQKLSASEAEIAKISERDRQSLSRVEAEKMKSRDLETELDDLKSEAADKQIEIERLENLVNKNSQSSDIQKSAENSLNKKIVGLKQEIKDFKKKAQALERQLSRKQNEAENLQSKLSECEAESVKLAEREAQSLSEIDAAKSKSQDLEIQLDELKTELKEKDDESGRLENLLNKKSKSSDVQRSNENSLKEKITGLKKELKGSKKQSQKLDKQLGVKKNELESLNSKLERASKDAEEQAKQAEVQISLKETIDELKGEIEDYKTEIKDLSKSPQRKPEVSADSTALADLRKAHRERKIELKKAEKSVEKYQKLTRKQEKVQENFKTRISELQMDLEKTVDTEGELRAQIDELNDQVSVGSSKQGAEIEGLKKELVNLRKALKEEHELRVQKETKLDDMNKKLTLTLKKIRGRSDQVRRTSKIKDRVLPELHSALLETAELGEKMSSSQEDNSTTPGTADTSNPAQSSSTSSSSSSSNTSSSSNSASSPSTSGSSSSSSSKQKAKTKPKPKPKKPKTKPNPKSKPKSKSKAKSTKAKPRPTYKAQLATIAEGDEESDEEEAPNDAPQSPPRRSPRKQPQVDTYYEGPRSPAGGRYFSSKRISKRKQNAASPTSKKKPKTKTRRQSKPKPKPTKAGKPTRRRKATREKVDENVQDEFETPAQVGKRRKLYTKRATSPGSIQEENPGH